MKIKFIASLLALTAYSFSANSQITVTTTETPLWLVENIILGFGVTASNITVNGSPLNSNNIQGNCTYFDASGTTFPINSGVLLSTGNGIGAIGPNSIGSYTDNNPATPNVAGDPHLNAIANAAPTNGIVLEFDFIPSGDTISFNYIFGSDEYPEFSPSTFNDAFGFFLWGPGVTGPYALGGYPGGGANLAIIPGTNIPVTINNLGPGAGQYPAYYQNNLAGAAYGTAIEYDGTTTLLSANATVQCGQTYHIKLAISNVGDQSYDSGVFLQANSFASEAVQVAVATVSGDTTVIEVCSTADLMFIRPQSQIGDTLVINYVVTGTATMGADYPNLPNPVTFLPGQDTIILTIDPLADGFPDNLEYVTITTETITVCGDTIISSGTLYFLDSVPIPINEPDPIIPCANDSVQVVVTAQGGLGPYTFTWSDPLNQVGDTVYLASTNSGLTGSIDYYVTVTDACGYTDSDTVTITLNQTLQIDTMFAGPASSCLSDGFVSASVIGVTDALGQPFYNWSGPGQGGTISVDGTATPQILPTGWYYFTVQDDVCNVEDSMFVDVLNPPLANFTTSVSIGCSPLIIEFTNTSQNSVTFEWDFGNGNVQNVNGMANQTETFLTDAIVILTAYDAAGCPSVTQQSITVEPCGCTDPAATNYNSTATIDDGSCFYPTPTVEAPNIITPNGDGANDIFEMDITNAVNVELVIINRWGNVMHESNGVNPTWDGKTPGGTPAGEGTYFYKYSATGPGESPEPVIGHGFVQVVIGK